MGAHSGGAGVISSMVSPFAEGRRERPRVCTWEVWPFMISSITAMDFVISKMLFVDDFRCRLLNHNNGSFQSARKFFGGWAFPRVSESIPDGTAEP
jgi:hypothetical protein